MTTLDEKADLYEIQLHKKIIPMDLPIQIGFTILQHAKLRMLQFYYDFLDYYIDRSNFELAEMDTDSFYLALSDSNINNIIKPDKKQQFHSLLYENCKDILIHPENNKFFIPRQCCEKHHIWDSKIPGLFKIEYTGQELISLNSKCYIGATKQVTQSPPSEHYTTLIIAQKLLNKARKYNSRSLAKRLMNSRKFKPRKITYTTKISCKGISKRHLKNPLYTYRNVLFKKAQKGSTNKGFIFKENKIFTYEQFRKGFSYLYIKREILQDGITTIPLNITLKPTKQRN